MQRIRSESKFVNLNNKVPSEVKIKIHLNEWKNYVGAKTNTHYKQKLKNSMQQTKCFIFVMSIMKSKLINFCLQNTENEKSLKWNGNSIILPGS